MYDKVAGKRRLRHHHTQPIENITISRECNDSAVRQLFAIRSASYTFFGMLVGLIADRWCAAGSLQTR